MKIISQGISHISHISQGRLATRLRYGGIFINHLTANSLLNQTVNRILKIS